MTTTELMTPGQMRQLMNTVGSTIPADLSQAEVQRILNGPQMRRYLETFWDAMRTDEDKGLYVRLPKGDIVEYLREQQLHWQADFTKFAWLARENEKRLRERLEPFHYKGDRSRHGTWIKKILFESESPAEIWRQLKHNGYRSADFRELVAYSTHDRPTSSDQYTIIAAEGCDDYDYTGGVGSWVNEDTPRVEFFFRDGIGYDDRYRCDGVWKDCGSWVLAVKL
jgi:hypothetical protein